MQDFIKEHSPKIKAVIRKLTGSNNEDIEQEVYLKVFENASQYKEKGKLSSWLKVITTNVCLDYFKTRQYKMSKMSVSDDEINFVSDNTPSQEDILDIKKRQKLILKAVNELPYKMRRVVELCEFEEMSYKEVAQKMDISEGTVKSRLFHAREILSKKLDYLKGE